jgi:hypothetical protein
MRRTDTAAPLRDATARAARHVDAVPERSATGGDVERSLEAIVRAAR